MKKIIRSLAVLTAFAALAACSADYGSDPDALAADPAAAGPTPSADKAIIRVVHASADAPAVDVYAKGADKPLITGLAYGQTSAWLEVPPGDYELELRAAGAKSTDPIAYKSPVVSLTGGEKLSAIAAGLLGKEDADAAFRIVPVVEGFGPAVLGATRVRVIHAGSDAPTVGIDVGNDNPALPEVPALARFTDTGAEGVALPSGKPLAIGIDAGGVRVTSFTTPTLPDGANVIVIATGLVGKLARERDGFSLLAVGPNGSIGFVKQDPIVYALHASPDAPSVDAFVGPNEIIDDLSFSQLSKAIQVQPGTYTIDVFAHAMGSTRPGGEPALAASTGQLEAGERYLTVAAGLLSGAGGQALELVSYREGFALDSGKPQLRAVHASPDAPEVDIGLAPATQLDTVLFPGLSFSKASSEEGLGATAGHLPIAVTPAGQASAVVARFTVPVAMDNRAFVVAGGALAPHLGQSFRLFVVDTATAPWSVASVLPH